LFNSPQETIILFIDLLIK